MSLSMIWAQSRNGVIGAGGGLPWRLPEDLAHFKDATMGQAVLMGSHTWQSLPQAMRPLPGRDNYVLTSRGPEQFPGATCLTDLTQAIALFQQNDVWCIGGGTVYAALAAYAERALITVVDCEIDGDTFAPVLEAGWRLDSASPWLVSKTGLRYQINDWRRDAT